MELHPHVGNLSRGHSSYRFPHLWPRLQIMFPFSMGKKFMDFSFPVDFRYQTFLILRASNPIKPWPVPMAFPFKSSSLPYSHHEICRNPGWDDVSVVLEWPLWLFFSNVVPSSFFSHGQFHHVSICFISGTFSIAICYEYKLWYPRYLWVNRFLFPTNMVFFFLIHPHLKVPQGNDRLTIVRAALGHRNTAHSERPVSRHCFVATDALAAFFLRCKISDMAI